MKLEPDFETLLSNLNISSSRDKAKECPFSFLRMVCGIFDEENDIPSQEIITNAQKCMCHLPDICNPKELIVALTEELSRECEFVSLQKAYCLLPAFQKSLESIQKQQHKFVNLVYNTICNYLERTLDVESIPMEKEASNEKKSSQLVHTSKLIVESFSYFADKMSNSLKEDPSLKNEAQDITVIILRFMSNPFSILPSVLINDDDYHDSMQIRSLKMFSNLQSDLIKFQASLLETEERRHRQHKNHLRIQKLRQVHKTTDHQLGAGENGEDLDEDEDSFADPPFSWDIYSGMVTLSHFVFNDQHYLSTLIPHVYSHEFLFKWHLNLIQSSISSSKCFSIDKSLSLLSSLLKRVGTGQLKQEFLDFENFKPVVEKILIEVTSPSSKTIGRKSLDCLNMMIWSFSPPARLDFFTYLLFKNEHSGFLGFLITAIKSQLDESLNNQDGVFNDAVVNNLARYIFTLDLPRDTVNVAQGRRRKVNIHENMDRYMASLNFLRFLVIRYGKQNEGEAGENDPQRFNISKLLPDVEEKFLHPLKRELSKSRTDLLEEMAMMRGEMERDEEKVEMTVGSEMFRGMKADEEMKVNQVMLVKLELIESILNRVGILIHDVKNSG